LFTSVQVARGSGSEMAYNPKLFKKVTLATYYGIKHDDNLAGYVKTFCELNPALKDCNIEYDFMIRVYG
jgi:hypothetical protein